MHVALPIVPSRQSCEDNKRCMRSFPNLSYAFSTSHRLPAPSAGNSSLARPSHVSGPSLLYVWCQVDHLCARRTDTGYTHRQSSMCMSRYQYFSLVKGGPYRPRTKTPQSALLTRRLCSTGVASYKARKLCPRKVFTEFLLCGRPSVASAKGAD